MQQNVSDAEESGTQPDGGFRVITVDRTDAERREAYGQQLRDPVNETTFADAVRSLFE